MNEKCGNCRFYKPYIPTEPTAGGVCRVRSVPRFPVRQPEEWCGEYQAAQVRVPLPTNARPAGFDGNTPLVSTTAGRNAPPPPGSQG